MLAVSKTHCILIIPVSILYESIAGRYRPVRVADGPITARCRFIKNASWDIYIEYCIHILYLYHFLTIYLHNILEVRIRIFTGDTSNNIHSPGCHVILSFIIISTHHCSFVSSVHIQTYAYMYRL